jgi:hypothetical protein
MRLKKRAVAAGGRETDMARLDGRLPGQRGPWAALAAARHGTYQTTNPPERKRLRASGPYGARFPVTRAAAGTNPTRLVRH